MLARLFGRTHHISRSAKRPPGTPGRRIALYFGGALLAAAIALVTAAGEASSYAGLPLAEALERLQSRGLPILFSSALVRPEMRVEAEPAGSAPREVLAELLRPHGLAAHDGPDGTLLIVPGRLPAPQPQPSIRGRVRDRDTWIGVAGAEVVVAEAGVRGETAGDGSFELTGVVPGVYSLEARKFGFLRQRLDNVRIEPGRVTRLTIDLLPLPTTLDEIEVVPRLEVGSIHEGTILRRSELERVPTPRDPWAVVTQTPGILSDRINVGGSESGVQALFLAPASTFQENVFTVDGVNTTDMAALGSSALYYDFDQFEELQISTGGADVKTATAGVTLRMVTKRGTDAVRGSGRMLRTDEGGILGLFPQGSSRVADQLAPGQADVEQGNRVDRIFEYGLELGGPLISDRLWAWGSYGANDIRLETVGGSRDGTGLDNGAFKLNAQLGPSSSLVASANLGDKRKENRGAGPGRAVETHWRQRGPVWVYRLETTHVVGSKLFVSGQYSLVDGGFSLIPRAGEGPAGGEALLAEDGVWKNGYIGGTTDRDSETVEGGGSLYFDAGRLSHTLDFGGSVRQYRYADDFRWPGPRQAYGIACANAGSCDSGDLVYFERRGLLRVDLDYTALWIQDAASAGRWTWSAGLRLDLQDGRNPPGTVPANPAIPELLPSVTYPGDRGVFDWRTLSPRLTASYAFDDAGKTLLRLSYGRFAGQLGVSDVGRVNPLESTELFFTFQDANGDHVWQDDEPLQFVASFGTDPENPLVSAHRTDPGLEPELTDELLAGVEHAFSDNWVAGLNLSYRKISGVDESRDLIDDGGTVRAARASDYVLERVWEVSLPDGRRRMASFYALGPGLARTGGELLTNGDRGREYLGVTLSFNRRPNDRWMTRGYLNLGQATWNVPPSFRLANDPTDFAGFGDDDRDLYAAQARGARRNIFLQSTWSAQWSGYFRLAPWRPWGFTVAANFFAREGYPIPYAARFVSAIDGVDREGQVTEGIDEFRLEDVYTLDLSLQKDFNWRDRLEVTLSLSVFNVLNENFVLRRERNVNSPRANHLEETLAPRIARLGLRVSW